MGSVVFTQSLMETIPSPANRKDLGMDETMVNETIDETTTVDEFYDDVEDAGVLGKVLLGGAAVAVGVAGGFAVKNKDKIKAFFDEKKEARRQKKVAKTMERLAKLEAKAPKTEDAEKKEE